MNDRSEWVVSVLAGAEQKLADILYLSCVIQETIIQEAIIL